jgi:type IV pilus assembly protein PilF
MKLSRAVLARALLAAAGIGALGGCANSVSTTSGPITEAQVARDGTPGEDATRRARVRMELALAYFSRGQNDVALEETQRVLAADPTLGGAYNLQGLIYASKGEDALAEQNFRRALQVNPKDSDSMQNLGWFYCQRKRYAEADAQFEQALATPQNRDTARALHAQGVCHSMAGRLPEAEAALTKSYEQDPGNASTSINLAEVLFRRGEFERARFYIRRVNNAPSATTAQTLWLAARIENKLGNQTGAQDLGRQLRSRFAGSREAAAFDRGQFDD